MNRYVEETKRLFSVLESKFADGREWLVGDAFTLAEAACVPWLAAAAYVGEALLERPFDLRMVPHH